MSLKQKFSLEDQVFIVTGGLGLLGQQHVSAIAEFGGNTIILDTNQNNGTQITEKIKSDYNTDCLFIHCDITDEKNVSEVKDEIIRKYDNIDGLINNATIDPKISDAESETNFTRLENFSINQWNKEINVGLTGAMLCSKIFGCEMANNNNGVILNIASDLSVIAPDQRIYKLDDINEIEQPVKPITYSVIKHGIIGLTKYLSTYWADKNIRVNALSPGGVYSGQNENFVNKLSNLIPMNRMADLDEYKAAIIFLLSDASSYMTGQNIIIDGGRSVW